VAARIGWVTRFRPREKWGLTWGNEETPTCRSQMRVPVAPTGIDPVTFRFSVERSTN
jgi:hypothetical protein